MKSYTIHFDKMYLILKGSFQLILLLSAVVLLAVLPLNPISIFLVATLCWFLGKGAGRAFIRCFKHKPICVLYEDKIEIAMPSGDGKIMKVKDITYVERKVLPHRIQLVIHGKNIEHPSGAYLIDIKYPFAKQQFTEVETGLNKWFLKRQIRVENVMQNKKEVVASV